MFSPPLSQTTCGSVEVQFLVWPALNIWHFFNMAAILIFLGGKQSTLIMSSILAAVHPGTIIAK